MEIVEPAILNVRNNFWSESLVQFTYLRDFSCVFFLWHVLHVGVNVRASSNIDCPFFDSVPLALSGVSMLLYLVSLLQRSAGAWGSVADVFGLGVGTYLQMAAKPSAWALSIGTAECALTVRPYAEFVFFAGELMTFPLLVRAMMYGFSRFRTGLSRTLIVVGLLAGSAGSAVALHFLLRAADSTGDAELSSGDA